MPTPLEESSPLEQPAPSAAAAASISTSTPVARTTRAAAARKKKYQHKRSRSLHRTTLPLLGSDGGDLLMVGGDVENDASKILRVGSASTSSSNSGSRSSSSIASSSKNVTTITSTTTTRTTRRTAQSSNLVRPYQIRPMAMKDVGPVYHLGNAIFTAGEFPILFRTWDDFTVVEHYEGSAEFCFVVETTNVSNNSKEKCTHSLENTTDLDDKPQQPFQSELIGFLLGTTVTKAAVGTRGYIEWVAVAPEYRRRGIAHELIQRFVQVAQGSPEHVSLLLADTPADNEPAIGMFEKAGLSHKIDHVYLMCQMPPELKCQHVDEDDMTFQYPYTVSATAAVAPTTASPTDETKTQTCANTTHHHHHHKKKQKLTKKHRITIRNMEIDDLHPIHAIGEQIFTQKSANLYNFWDEHLVLQSYLSDPELCAVATVPDGNGGDRVVGFAFGTTIEKPRSSWKYGYLVWLGCAPEFQGLGIAQQLYGVMLELFSLEKVRMLMIDTQRNNDGALRFFRKLGFGHDEEHVYLCNSTTYSSST